MNAGDDVTKGRVVIAGGNGFLGRGLAKALLAGGYEVIALSRAEDAAFPWQTLCWDGVHAGAWAAALEGAAAVINLVGRSVDCVKTPENCDEILRSRVDATLALGRAIAGLKKPPTVWVQMSTAHIYGDPRAVVCDEDSSLGIGLAPEVGRAWEGAFAASLPSGMRGVVLRTSFVLGRDGGALAKLATLARLGLGGTVGDGHQGISWLHQDDLNRLILRAIIQPAMTGTYVASSPSPVANRIFMRLLRQAVGVRWGLPAPATLVRLAAPLLLKTDPDLALAGRFCVSRRLQEEGFRFCFPTLAEALAEIYAADRVPAPAGDPIQARRVAV